MHQYYKIFVKFLFGLLIFVICASFGLILFYSEVYEFAIINKFRVSTIYLALTQISQFHLLPQSQQPRYCETLTIILF